MYHTNSCSALPKLNSNLIAACEKQLPAFDALYTTLRTHDAAAASWLQDAAERLAPADPAEKQKYACLALELYYLLQQASINAK